MGFRLAPRLNAAGRLVDMRLGIECLLTASDEEARVIAERLSQLNADRRVLEAQMQVDALAQIDARLDALEGQLPAGLTLFDPGWHQGVIGLVAGPLMLLWVVFARPAHSTRWFIVSVVLSLVGFGLLVLRQPSHRDPTSGDDGARV